MHILESLLVDLKEDQIDYDHFVTNAQARADAATYLEAVANGIDSKLSSKFRNAGEAMHFIGITARLQTQRSAIQEMTATGAGITIEDNDLRARILQYYALSTDRSAINGFIDPEIQRYRRALEQLGVSYSDAGNIDTDTVLRDKTVQAIIRSLGAIASFAPLYCEDLMQSNRELIEIFESKLSSS